MHSAATTTPHPAPADAGKPPGAMNETTPAMPYREPFLAAALVGFVAGFFRALFDNEKLPRALLLASIAAVQCGLLCAIAVELWPETSKMLIVAATGLLGFSPRLVLKRIDAAIGVAGRALKKLAE